jgi:serine/threonine-protein kinase
MATNRRGVQAALKIRPHADDEESSRFRREFERLRTLRLPGVIRVLDTGVDQGYIYFAMELARGVRWDHFLDASRGKGERIQRAVDAGAGIARILASIHQLHLAHRDIKPANVHVEADLVQRTLRVTLLDFGTHRFGSLRDESGELHGTPAYMSPEQRLGMPHDHRGDCYALGVLLYEAISQTDNAQHPVGRPRPSLTRVGTDVPLAIADLVDRLLRLDPASRPTAAEAEAVLRAVAQGIPLPPASWPRPISHTGDPAPLLSGDGVVVGPPGTGRKRLVNEARWQWYTKGYRSVAAPCAPHEVYGAWRIVLDELFREQDPQRRRTLAGSDAPVLRAIWPGLPVAVDEPLQNRPGPTEIATAIGAVLTRCQPIAIVLMDLDQADLGTREVVAQLAQQDRPRVYIWATSSRSFPGLSTIEPPPWDSAAASAVWSDLVPGSPPPKTLPEHPVAGLAAAWQAFAKVRSLPPPPEPMPAGLVRLSALRSPFPRSVAVRMAPNLDHLIQAGHLVSVDPEAEGAATPIRFASAATHVLARLHPSDRAEVHGLAYEAWMEEPNRPDVIRARAHHALLGDRVDETLLSDVIHVALNRGDPAEIRRWLELQEMICGPTTLGEGGIGFIPTYAQLFVDLMMHPERVQRQRLRELAAAAETPEHRGLAAFLKLKHGARSEDPERITADGRRWAKSLAKGHPGLASRMLRETALVHLSEGQLPAALKDAKRALDLSRKAVEADEDEITEQLLSQTTLGSPRRLSQTEVDAAITYSAALVYSGAITEAADLAGGMARRCVRADRPRGAASFLTNQAIALHRLGNRAEANICVAEARTLHHRHLDPDVLANWAVVAARLAVERGDLPAGARLLDEAITAGQATQGSSLLAEAWTISLDAAAQAGQAEEAQRALSTYGTESLWSARDHWPAALARWHWAMGDLEGALQATETERIGFGGACVEAERARLQLVSGKSESAIRTCRTALARPRAEQYQDLHIFLRLVLGAAEAHHDGDYVPLVSETRDRQWVHLYLGALHLDAIRRRRRGENVSAVLRQLDDRSADVGHALYRALSRASGW